MLWDQLFQAVAQPRMSLIESFNRRCQAIIRVKGGQLEPIKSDSKNLRGSCEPLRALKQKIFYISTQFSGVCSLRIAFICLYSRDCGKTSSLIEISSLQVLTMTWRVKITSYPSYTFWFNSDFFILIRVAEVAMKCWQKS